MNIQYFNNPKDSYETYNLSREMLKLANEKLILKKYSLKKIKENKASVIIKQGRKQWLIAKYKGDWLLLFRILKKRKITNSEQEEYSLIKSFDDFKSCLLYLIINMDSEVYPNV